MSPETRAHLKKYTQGIAIITAIVALGGYYLLGGVLKSPVADVFPFITLFVAVVTLAIHIMLVRKVGGKPNQFINSFMLSNTGKLFIYLLFMVVYALVFKDQGRGFCYQLFWVVCYLHLLRYNSI
ncbi:MAG: hypothetical protein M0D57_00680 [Sphingobacteriales bacterium JAD_PAG50586_3]|nr:MAG: hypothetical protein M0D57_00680 [Sphingobacteriales bacterium JAD_PAG50586_3]